MSFSRSSHRRSSSKFRKFQGPDADGVPRSDFSGSPRVWEYDPRRRHRPNGHEGRSQWHMPYNHPDAERSTSVGQTDPIDDRRSIEAGRRSTSARRSVDRDRRSTSRPGSSHEVPAERSTPNRKDIPKQEISSNGRKRRKRDGTDEEDWPGKELPPSELELKPIPEFHLNMGNPAEDSPSESITMVIIDQTSPNHELSPEHATTIEKKLMKKLLKAVKMGTSVQFETQEYDGKFLRFTCANQETCDWLSSAVESIGKLWEGASLAVVTEQDIPKFSQVTAFIPGKDISQETCQNALAVQNPKLDIHKWVLWECKENKEAQGFDLVFGVPKDLLPKVLLVKGKAYYMFSKVILNIISDKDE